MKKMSKSTKNQGENCRNPQSHQQGHARGSRCFMKREEKSISTRFRITWTDVELQMKSKEEEKLEKGAFEGNQKAPVFECPLKLD